MSVKPGNLLILLFEYWRQTLACNAHILRHTCMKYSCRMSKEKVCNALRKIYSVSYYCSTQWYAPRLNHFMHVMKLGLPQLVW